MKTYSLDELIVAKIKRNNEIVYVICKKNNIFQTYTDILTGEKIKPIYHVEPLTSYYNIAEKFNYKTGKYIRLTKADILKKYQEINELKRNEEIEKELILKETKKASDNKKEELKVLTSIEEKEILKSVMSQSEIDTEELLEEVVKTFFPNDGQWYSGCFRRSKELYMSNLPCNLRDDKWLAAMLIREKNLEHLNYYDVLDFVRNSEVFKDARHNYELEIVKWQIDWIRNGGEGWISSEEYGGDAVFFTSVCDLGFRQGVLNTLLAIGMNKDVIEEGLEKYADMWREKYMKIAFHNEYEPVFYLADPNVQLKPVDQEHKQAWLKYRKYEYYQNHKRVVDKYGTPDDDMLMSNKEAYEIKQYLDIKHLERKKEIEEYKKEAYGHGRNMSLWR